jgi:hypothetical protein
VETVSHSPRLLGALVAGWSIPSILFPVTFAAVMRAHDAYVPGFSVATRAGTHVLDLGYRFVWPAFGLAYFLMFLPISLALYFGTRRKSRAFRIITLLSGAIVWCCLVAEWFAFGTGA